MGISDLHQQNHCCTVSEKKAQEEDLTEDSSSNPTPLLGLLHPFSIHKQPSLSSSHPCTEQFSPASVAIAPDLAAWLKPFRKQVLLPSKTLHSVFAMVSTSAVSNNVLIDFSLQTNEVNTHKAYVMMVSLYCHICAWLGFCSRY